MKKIIKFSKPLSDVFALKKKTQTHNNFFLKKQIKINLIYKKQKKRKLCTNCKNKLGKFLFKSHYINYILCKKCGHLNGEYENTATFSSLLYSRNKGTYFGSYTKNYISRVNNIYVPKVKFIKSAIGRKIKILDIGSGAGNFLKACEINGVSAEGYETNKELVNFGKKKLKFNRLHCVNSDNIFKLIEQNKFSNVLTLINVFEHLNDQNQILYSFKRSEIDYILISVPLFSLTSIIENIFQNVHPRLLAGSHTHLYTKESLYYLFKKFKLKVVAEWWFGEDFLDLYRSFLCNIKNQDLKSSLDKYLLKVINDLQYVLDKNKICSEVHFLLKK